MPVAANEDAIRQRAYEIWLREGQPDGQEQDHWFRAESEFGEIPSDLDRNPAIGSTPGTWDQGGPDDIAGENTNEGDVMNDTEASGAVNHRQRGRTNS